MRPLTHLVSSILIVSRLSKVSQVVGQTLNLNDWFGSGMLQWLPLAPRNEWERSACRADATSWSVGRSDKLQTSRACMIRQHHFCSMNRVAGIWGDRKPCLFKTRISFASISPRPVKYLGVILLARHIAPRIIHKTMAGKAMNGQGEHCMVVLARVHVTPPTITENNAHWHPICPGVQGPSEQQSIWCQIAF